VTQQGRNGLIRLAILIGSVIALLVIGVKTLSNSGGSSGQTAAQAKAAAPARLHAIVGRGRLPQSLHGEAVAATPSGLLVIGGADSSGASTDRVYQLNPTTGAVSPNGTLVQPLHDLAATTVQRKTLVFGGGDTSTVNLVQVLPLGGPAQGGPATTVGHLPDTLSDLSAVHLGGAAYVIGGYNGTKPSASVLQTVNGVAFTRVARLPTPVRYAAVAALPDKIYVFGGELANGRDTDEIQEYDIATERAVIAGHLPQPISHASAATLDRAIYLVGGRVGGVSGSGTDRIYRFNEVRNAVFPAGRLPQPVYDAAAATFNGRAYLIGGIGSGGSSLDSVIALR
jgi:Kelch motif